MLQNNIERETERHENGLPEEIEIEETQNFANTC